MDEISSELIKVELYMLAWATCWHIYVPDGGFTLVNRFTESDCDILMWGPAETQLAGKKFKYLICGMDANLH